MGLRAVGRVEKSYEYMGLRAWPACSSSSELDYEPFVRERGEDFEYRKI